MPYVRQPLLLSFAVPEKPVSVDAPATALAAEVQGVDEGRGRVSPSAEVELCRSHRRVVHDATEKWNEIATLFLTNSKFTY